MDQDSSSDARNSSPVSAQGGTTLGRSLGTGNAKALEPIELKDGAKIQVWCKDGVGTPLLFLYGLGCSNAHWKYQARHFQDAGRLTLQLDFRGHGQSTLGRPPRPLTLRTLTQDIAEVMQRLKVKEAVVLGQSMGGSVALQLAHDYPDFVRAIVLQGSPGRDPFGKMQIGLPVARVVRALTALNRKLPRWTRYLNRAAGFAPQIAREIVRLKGFNASLARSEDIDEYINNFFAADPNVFYELAQDLSEFDITNFEHVVACPALILAGSRDLIVPLEECRWLAKRLPGAELQIIPHGSHCPHLDDPHYVNRRIETFLKTYQP